MDRSVLYDDLSIFAGDAQIKARIITLLSIGVKDANTDRNPVRRLLEFLVVTFSKAEEHIEFCLKGLTDLSE
jgi:hypothetical protein